MERKLKKAYFAIGMGFILCVAITFSTTIMFSLVAGSMVNIFGISYDKLAYLGIPILLTVVGTMIGNVIPFLISTRLVEVDWSKWYRKGNYTKWTIMMGLVTCLGFNYIGGMISGSIALLLEKIQLMPVAPDLSLSGSLLNQLVMFVFIVVIAPVTEEFALRGVVLGILKPYGEVFAIVLSAILFGLIHGNFVQAPTAVCAGLVLAFITVRTESVIPATLIHMGNNFIAVLQELILTYGGEDAMFLQSSFIILVIIGAICMVLYYYKDIRLLDTGESYKGMRLKALLLSWPMLLTFAIYGMISIQNVIAIS